MVRRISYFVMVLVFVACERMDITGFFVSPGDNVDRRFSQSLEYTGDSPYAVVEASEEYVFYVCTDAHLDRTWDNLDAFVCAFRNDEDASFGLFLGDAVERKGMMEAFASAVEWNEVSQKYDYPLFAVPGNHDMFFSQWDDFRHHFRASVYYVEVKAGGDTDLFIALDSASGTLGGKQMKWLRQLLETSRGGYRHCVVFTHTNMFYTDSSQGLSGNMPLEETLAMTELFDRYDVEVVFQGHAHCRQEILYRGCRYITVGAVEDASRSPEYLEVRMIPSGIGSYQFRSPLIDPEL